MPFISLDADSDVPVYEQIRSQIAAQIASETLPAGAKLPTIRQLASDLGLAVNTVAHAYRELETAGLVTTRPRHGTTVAAGHSALPGAQVRERLRAAAKVYAAVAKQLGASPADAEAAVLAELHPAP